ncbi:unannotated protein [freshwater metagenome]|uniref:Unannotated protein n=1 Tax=freshwater metagenome TaxID=449393 RepID=A0A6J7I3X1_9ZZZZ
MPIERPSTLSSTGAFITTMKTLLNPAADF